MQRLKQRRRWTAPRTAGLPGDVSAPHRRGNALEQPLRLAFTDPPPGAQWSACGLVSMKSERQSKENLQRRTSAAAQKGTILDFFIAECPV